MTGKVIQGFFLGGQPKLASLQPRIAAPPIQARTAASAPATAFAGQPPGPPIPAFGARPSGPPTPAFGPRPGAVQRHGAGNAFAIDSGAVGLASGGGKPLPDAVRGKMEAVLGADFSNVRVHVGPQAERIGAIAFTVGSDIYFAPGRYQPGTVQGQQLLGHELAHVVQQRHGRVRNPLGSGLAVVQDRALEAEADRLGNRAASFLAQAQIKKPSQSMSMPAGVLAPIVQRRMIGEEGRHHMHIEIHQPHYKNGNDRGSRIDIGGVGNDDYAKPKLEEVIDAVKDRLGEPGAQACYDWCLGEARRIKAAARAVR